MRTAIRVNSVRAQCQSEDHPSTHQLMRTAIRVELSSRSVSIRGPSVHSSADEDSNQRTIRPLISMHSSACTHQHALISMHSSWAIPPQAIPGLDESQRAVPPGSPPALTIAALFAVDESRWNRAHAAWLAAVTRSLVSSATSKPMPSASVMRCCAVVDEDKCQSAALALVCASRAIF